MHKTAQRRIGFVSQNRRPCPTRLFLSSIGFVSQSSPARPSPGMHKTAQTENWLRFAKPAPLPYTPLSVLDWLRFAILAIPCRPRHAQDCTNGKLASIRKNWRPKPHPPLSVLNWLRFANPRQPDPPRHAQDCTTENWLRFAETGGSVTPGPLNQSVKPAVVSSTRRCMID
jgi:hypothetical protein